jgi:hypothetical protein
MCPPDRADLTPTCLRRRQDRDFEIADDLLLAGQGRCSVVGTRGDLDAAEVRRYVTVESRVAMREPHDPFWCVLEENSAWI